MNGRSAAEVGLGVAGIYLLATSAPGYIAAVAAVLSSRSADLSSPWVGVAGLVATSVCAAILVLARRRLAGWICPNTEQPGNAFTLDDLHAAAISVVGIVLLTSGLTGIAHEVALVASPFRPVQSLVNYAEPLVSIVIGLLLFAGARGIVALWHAARRGEPSHDS